MASRDQKDEPLVPSWDGEVQGWSEYSRRVRLCWSQMPTHKRYTLGPKLVLRLRGKAWEAAASVDHSRLCQPDGTSYLLQFLKDKLGRLPVPDVGQHLDELFVRLRRPAGMDLLSWCTQLRESYKRVQRSLARTKKPTKDSGVQTEDFGVQSPTTSPQPSSEPHREPPSPSRSPASPATDYGTRTVPHQGDVGEDPDGDAWSSHGSQGDGWWHGCHFRL